MTSFIELPLVKYRDITSRVNGQRTDNRATQCLQPPVIGGEDVLICWQRRRDHLLLISIISVREGLR